MTRKINKQMARRCLGFLLVAVALLYSPSLRNGFTFDDRYFVKAEPNPGQLNPMTSELLPIKDYFNESYSRPLHKFGHEYRPVSTYSFALVYHVFGRHFKSSPLGESLPQHALNLICHLIAILLVYQLLRRFPTTRWAALGGAAVFGVHSIHSEAVVWIVGRCELFAFSFGCAGVLLALRGIRKSDSRGRILSFAAANVLFFLAFCSKENSLAWPPALLMILLAQEEVVAGEMLLTWKRLKSLVLPVIQASALPVVVFFLLRGNMIDQLEQAAALPNIMANPLAHVSFFERFLTGVMINGYGLFLTLFPFKLACDYQFAVFPTLDRFYDPRFLLALAALLSVLVGGLACLRRKPLLFVAMTIFLGFSFLISNIPVAIGIPFAERLYYTPSLALSFVVAHAIQAPYAEDRFRKFFFLFLGVWMVFASAKIVERSLLWKDDRTLYTNDIQVQPRSSRLHYQMADFAMFDGDTEKQFYHMEQAFLLKPEVARAWLRFAWFLDDPSQSLEATRRGLAVTEGGGQKYKFHLQWTRANEFKALKQSSSEQLSRKLALKHLKILLADDALRKELRELLADNSPAVGNWYEVSALLARRGELVLAEACLREGLEASEKSSAPHRFQLHWALAHNLLAQEKLSEAKDEFEALVHEEPARVRQNLESLRRIQATDDGALAFLSVLNTGMELEPAEPLWALYRGLLDVELGNVKEARIDLERAIQGLAEHPRLEEARLALQELAAGS